MSLGFFSPRLNLAGLRFADENRLSKRTLPTLTVAGFFLAMQVFAGTVLAQSQLAFLRSSVVKDASDDREGVGSMSAPASTAKDVARQAIERNDFYDPDNPGRALLQRHDDATRQLPRDAVGFPDWMRALREGAIQPRSTVRGTGSMDVLNLDIVMRNTKEMPNVRFPHLSHTLWLACSNCHPIPFVPVAGGNEIRMADIFRGKFCGMCHDRVAFITYFSCDRCHSVPQGGTSRP